MEKGGEKREGPGEKKERKEGSDTGREGKIRETGKREMKGERGDESRDGRKKEKEKS